MAFLIQEHKACQPLTHFKPDCVKEWEEWIGPEKCKKDSRCERAEKNRMAAWAAEKTGIRMGFEKVAIQADFLYENHVPREGNAALIW